MKIVWTSLAALTLSMNAYALSCPAGMQGTTDFDESVKAASRVLGQTVRNGSHADERATDGKPVRVEFINKGGKVAISVYRSTPPRRFDNKQINEDLAIFCTTSGKGSIITRGGAKIDIENNGDGTLAVTASQGLMSLSMTFGRVVGGSTSVASDRGNGR